MRGKTKVLIPREIVGDKSTLYQAFIKCAEKYDDNKDEAIQRLKMLPSPIKEAPVWLDKLTEIWRYEYGASYDELPQGTIISGTNVHLPVDELYVAIKIADKTLTRSQLLLYLKRLSQQDKHPDVIFEMRPLKKIRGSLRTNFEVMGLGEGSTTLDWQIRGRLLNIVLDVKHRIKNLIDHMEQIIPSLNQGANNISPDAPNPEALFKSTENKLKERCYLKQLQGVWIQTYIQEDEQRLLLYFKKTLNKKKIHFTIISDWKDDAYFLARNPFIKKLLKRVFCLTETKRFVSNEYSKTAIERMPTV